MRLVCVALVTILNQVQDKEHKEALIPVVTNILDQTKVFLMRCLDTYQVGNADPWSEYTKCLEQYVQTQEALCVASLSRLPRVEPPDLSP